MAGSLGRPERRRCFRQGAKTCGPRSAIMTSRREFLSDALGIGLVTASTWSIRADQARSMHGQSDSSASNSGRTTQEASLRWDVFLAPSIPAIATDVPPGETAAAVATDFVNADFWGARRCPGRHSHYGRAGSSPGELGGGERQESDDDLRHPWPRRSFLWHQYSSGAISRCPFRRAAGGDQDHARSKHRQSLSIRFGIRAFPTRFPASLRSRKS